MNTYLPIAVHVKNRRVVVVGGGMVAERKVISLLAAAAQVEIVSPVITPGLDDLVGSKRALWHSRRVQRDDIKGSFLVVAATDDMEVNEQVSTWARFEKILVNVVDKPALSDFISPAVFTARDAFVAVYTDGKNPPLSRDLKNYIKERWDDFISYRNRS